MGFSRSAKSRLEEIKIKDRITSGGDPKRIVRGARFGESRVPALPLLDEDFGTVKEIGTCTCNESETPLLEETVGLLVQLY